MELDKRTEYSDRNTKMNEHRKKAILVLQKYIEGEIKPEELLSNLPNVYDADELLDDIINTFCEPLSDYKGMASWNEIAQVSIRALKEDWSVDFFVRVLDEGFPHIK